jgi:hypothetical protein
VNDPYAFVNVITHQNSQWVSSDDYKKLLEAYHELKKLSEHDLNRVLQLAEQRNEILVELEQTKNARFGPLFKKAMALISYVHTSGCIKRYRPDLCLLAEDILKEYSVATVVEGNEYYK